jgi:hypothetical protein
METEKESSEVSLRRSNENPSKTAPRPALSPYPPTPPPIFISPRQNLLLIICATGNGVPRAFSVLLFTVETDLCCLPPLNQKTIQGWGTQSFVNT